MAYVSELVGRPVADVECRSVGRLQDLIASVRAEFPHPEIVAVVVKRPKDTIIVPLSEVTVLVAPAVPLSKRIEEISPYSPSEHDLYLVRDVLDRQIIDIDGVRVVRVNDLELARVNGHFYIANVDVGGLGLLRRLGVANIVERLASRFGRRLRRNSISWDDVELLPGDQPLRLKVPGRRIIELHPADLAEILSDLSRTASSRLLESLDAKTVADTLEEVEPDFQAGLVHSMSDEKAADVLEAMAPDEAADLLATLPRHRSKELLSLMGAEEAADVRKLLTYREDTAGGIMTTEYVAIHTGLTAQETLSMLRKTARDAETIAYVYVVNDDNHLIGVFSLQDLVLAPPDSPVTKFMHHRVVSVRLSDGQDKAAQIISKYNLVSVPVVDDQGRLHGVVTADDALDKIIPTKWKRRLPRLYH